MKYFIRIKQPDGTWKRTRWTTTGDAARPYPVKTKARAKECLKDALKMYPNEKYRIEEVA